MSKKTIEKKIKFILEQYMIAIVALMVGPIIYSFLTGLPFDKVYKALQETIKFLLSTYFCSFQLLNYIKIALWLMVLATFTYMTYLLVAYSKAPRRLSHENTGHN